MSLSLDALACGGNRQQPVVSPITIPTMTKKRTRIRLDEDGQARKSTFTLFATHQGGIYQESGFIDERHDLSFQHLRLCLVVQF